MTLDPPNNGRAADARQMLLICLGLAAATIAVFWRVSRFGFLQYDDADIFFNNIFVRNGLAWKSIVWGANTVYYEYWHPLMWWSHMLDCQLFGMNAGAHHLVSLGFHVANTLLVFVIFRRMTGMVWRSAVVAALFGLHPLHVESVAWLAERKDVLSTFFWLLSIWAYARYAQETRDAAGRGNNIPSGSAKGPDDKQPAPRREAGAKPADPKSAQNQPVKQAFGPKMFYALALLMFLFGLLSKPMVVTLPFVLVLLDYWPLGRMAELRFRFSDLEKGARTDTLTRMILEKWPFFGLTALFCFTTWYSVKLGNKFPSLIVTPAVVRFCNIPVAYVRYVWNTIFPHNLAVLYPMPHQLQWWQVVGALAPLAGVTWAVLRARGARYLAFGWLMFLGVLVPTIGIVQVGAQALADRYMYQPAIGLFVAAVWGISELSSGWRCRKAVLGGFGLAVLAACAALSWIQVQYWRDDIAMWTHCLTAGHESIIAHHDLGRAYIDAGDPKKGLEEFQAAYKMDPEGAYGNLGVGAALIAAGRAREATNYIAKALLVNPDDATAHGDMGAALLTAGDLNGAIAELSEAIRLRPDLAAPYANLGKTYSAMGESGKAIDNYMMALKLNPANAQADYYMGLEYLKRGELDQATSYLEKAAQCDPATLVIHLELASVCMQQHRFAETISEDRVALRINPNEPITLNNLAWILATTPDASLRNGTEAVKLAQRACELTSWNQTVFIGTLAAAYAEAGDFDKAVETAQKACDLATTHGEKELLQANQSLLEQYKNHQPFREKSGN